MVLELPEVLRSPALCLSESPFPLCNLVVCLLDSLTRLLSLLIVFLIQLFFLSIEFSRRLFGVAMELLVLDSKGSLIHKIVLELLNLLHLRLDEQLLLLGAILVLGLVEYSLIEFFPQVLVVSFQHVSVLIKHFESILQAFKLSHLFKELIDLILLELN